MKLSKREWMLYEVFRDHSGEFSTEDIADLIWTNFNRPESWKSRVSEIMQLLCAKTKALGMDPYISRTSPLGRGHKAAYSAINR